MCPFFKLMLWAGGLWSTSKSLQALNILSGLSGGIKLNSFFGVVTLLEGIRHALNILSVALVNTKILSKDAFGITLFKCARRWYNTF